MAGQDCRYPHYESEDSRLKSYKHWPTSLSTRPKELAEAGFFYTGLGDRTQCFFCGGGLKDWEPGAKPWEQHARWYNCAFVVQSKKENYVRRVVERWWGHIERKNVCSRSDEKPECQRRCGPGPCHLKTNLGAQGASPIGYCCKCCCSRCNTQSHYTTVREQF